MGRPQELIDGQELLNLVPSINQNMGIAGKTGRVTADGDDMVNVALGDLRRLSLCAAAWRVENNHVIVVALARAERVDIQVAHAVAKARVLFRHAMQGGHRRPVEIAEVNGLRIFKREAEGSKTAEKIENFGSGLLDGADEIDECLFASRRCLKKGSGGESKASLAEFHGQRGAVRDWLDRTAIPFAPRQMRNAKAFGQLAHILARIHIEPWSADQHDIDAFMKSC